MPIPAPAKIIALGVYGRIVARSAYGVFGDGEIHSAQRLELCGSPTSGPVELARSDICHARVRLTGRAIEDGFTLREAFAAFLAHRDAFAAFAPHAVAAVVAGARDIPGPLSRREMRVTLEVTYSLIKVAPAKAGWPPGWEQVAAAWPQGWEWVTAACELRTMVIDGFEVSETAYRLSDDGEKLSTETFSTAPLRDSVSKISTGYEACWREALAGPQAAIASFLAGIE